MITNRMIIPMRIKKTKTHISDLIYTIIFLKDKLFQILLTIPTICFTSPGSITKIILKPQFFLSPQLNPD